MVRGRFTISMLVLATALACGDDNAPATDDDTTGGAMVTSTATSGTTGDEACTPGYEGCACAENDLCLDGLRCLSQLCVDLPGGDSSTAPVEESSSSTTGLSAEGSGSSTGEPPDETTSTEGSTTGDESSSTAAEPECLENDNYCLEGELQTCVGGAWVMQTCEEHCAATGYFSPGCDGADGCLCEGFADPACEDGSLGLCYCADIDFGIICDQDQWNEFYDQCFAGVDYVACFVDFPYDNGNIDCATAEAACL